MPKNTGEWLQFLKGFAMMMVAGVVLGFLASTYFIAVNFDKFVTVKVMKKTWIPWFPKVERAFNPEEQGGYFAFCIWGVIWLCMITYALVRMFVH